MILQELESKDYPTYYILSRLRLRRFSYGYLSEMNFSQDVWRKFMLECKWIYSQMNKNLRLIFEPVFLYFEIKNIILFLRDKAISEKPSEILHLSLLPEDFKKVLITSTDITESIKDIERLFSYLSESFYCLSMSFKEKGLMGIENEIMKLFLESTAQKYVHPIIRVFIRSLIDSKNILILHKYMRWQLRGEPGFVKGGNIDIQELKRIFKKGDNDKIAAILYRFTGLKIHKENLEQSLIEGIRNVIIRHIEDPLSIANILNYIWGCFIQAINLGISLRIEEQGLDI
jgi:vacuolar-type H+-ATPase subunit C/Vma6